MNAKTACPRTLLRLANPVTATKVGLGLARTTLRAAGAGAAAATDVLLHSHDQEPPDVMEPDAAYLADSADVSDLADAAEVPPVAPEPTVVVEEPHPPAEPPVDVVGQALAAEAAAARGDADLAAGFAHEPRGASRDEEHGDAALQRAEVEELAAEAEEALAEELEAPGDAAVEASAEDHLSEPLIDPAEAAEVLARLEESADTQG